MADKITRAKYLKQYGPLTTAWKEYERIRKVSSAHTSLTNGTSEVYHSSLELNQAEEDLRHSLEVAITASIDLFQMVDKQQLSLAFIRHAGQIVRGG